MRRTPTTACSTSSVSATDPENIPAIADAAARLDRARQSMRLLRRAAA